MKKITLNPSFVTNEHINIDVDEEGIVVEANHTIEDVWINSPDVEVLWWMSPPHDQEQFPLTEGFLMAAKNDPKEFNNVRCNRMAFRSLKGKGHIYLIMQRN